jgi:N-acetylglutamate synthase-like GNAT family acetyltransferase
MSYSIRKYLKSDLEAVSKLYILAYSDDVWNEQWQLIDASNRITEITDSHGALAFVCEEDNKILGCVLGTVMSWHIGKQLEVKEFFVSPRHQDKGVGYCLMKQIDLLAPQLGVSEVFLWTKRAPKLLGLYQKCGYHFAEDTVELIKFFKHKEIKNENSSSCW